MSLETVGWMLFASKLTRTEYICSCAEGDGVIETAKRSAEAGYSVICIAKVRGAYAASLPGN